MWFEHCKDIDDPDAIVRAIDLFNRLLFGWLNLEEYEASRR
jgi:hypothetical protein